MADAPIFIIGTERSGSNLLRLILNAHPRISVPHPPHIIRYFHPLEPGYGDLSNETAFGRLVDDILALVRVHIHSWEMTLDRTAIVRQASPRNTFGVFVEIYEQYRTHQQKARWGCKSTFLIDHVASILERFPDARLIWLVRDPRDVAVSSQQSVFNPFHPFFTAQLWTRQQQTGLSLRRGLAPETLLRLRYEDLVADPQRWTERICAFVNEPFDENMLHFFTTPAAQRIGALSESWKYAARPIQPHRVARYRSELAPDAIQLVEQIAGATMEQLDYALAHPTTPATFDRRTRTRFRLLDRWWRARVELRSLRHDRNHWRRWARGLWLTYLRMRRGGGPSLVRKTRRSSTERSGR